MRPAASAWWERTVARALPESARDSILADLREEAAALRPRRGSSWVARQVLLVGARYQLECYRDASDVLKIALPFSAAVALLCFVPEASATLLAGAAAFGDSATRAIAELWRPAHLVSAVAAGLLLGWASPLAAHLSATRWHMTAVLAAGALAKDGWISGGLAAALLIGAVWLATRSRRANRQERFAS